MPPAALRGLSEGPPGGLLQRRASTHRVAMRALTRAIEMIENKKTQKIGYSVRAGCPRKNLRTAAPIHSRARAI